VHNRASALLGISVMLLSAWAAFAALAWPWKAALFPLVISVPLFCLASAEVLWTLLRPEARVEAKDFQLSDQVPAGVARRRTAAGFAWIVAFLALIVLAGFPVAVPVFLLLYLKLQGKESWTLSVAMTAAVAGVFYLLFDRMLHVPFPDGWILAWLGFG
jgi:hypothetical protein